MKSKNLLELEAINDTTLTTIIADWKDYDSKSVVLAYAELKRRDFSLSEEMKKKFDECIQKNYYSDIDSVIDNCLKEERMQSYAYFLNKDKLIEQPNEELFKNSINYGDN